MFRKLLKKRAVRAIWRVCGELQENMSFKEQIFWEAVTINMEDKVLAEICTLPFFPCVTSYCWFLWNVARCEKIVLILLVHMWPQSQDLRDIFVVWFTLASYSVEGPGRIQTYTGFTPPCLSEEVDLKCCPSLDVSSHIGGFFLSSVSLFSKLQCHTTLELLFCLTPSVL